jgi:hypothetical protein
MSDLDSEPEVIFAYTRAQALADGVLVDVSTLAKEAGFRWPVALTETLFHSYIVPALDLVAEGQSITGRLWDVLNVLRYTISKAKDTTFLQFSVLFVMYPASSPVSIELTSVAGPGDDGEPVITIMLPEDD